MAAARPWDTNSQLSVSAAERNPLLRGGPAEASGSPSSV